MLFACLADSRRRTLIRILNERKTPMRLETATQQIKDREGGLFDEGRRDTQQEIAIGLVHNHLPKLTEADIVTVNLETDTIDEGSNFDTALSHLEME